MRSRDFQTSTGRNLVRQSRTERTATMDQLVRWGERTRQKLTVPILIEKVTSLLDLARIDLATDDYEHVLAELEALCLSRRDPTEIEEIDE